MPHLGTYIVDPQPACEVVTVKGRCTINMIAQLGTYIVDPQPACEVVTVKGRCTITMSATVRNMHSWSTTSLWSGDC